MKEKKAKDTASKAASKRGLIIGTVALVAIIAGAAIAYTALAPAASSETDQLASNGGTTGSSGDAQADGEEHKLAPDFTMATADGETVSFSQLYGKPVVLNFWASTCGPCQQEMPGFQSAFDEHGSQVQFAMVDVVGFNGETEDRAKRFIAEREYTFPVFFDREGNASIEYGLTSIPRTFFIDAEGYVIAMGSGMLDESALQRGIAMLL